MLVIRMFLCVTHNVCNLRGIKECVRRSPKFLIILMFLCSLASWDLFKFSPTLKGSSKSPPKKNFQLTIWALCFGILKLGILVVNCKALLLVGPMVATIDPLLAWLAKHFLGLSAYQIAKSCLGPFVCCGKCGTSCSWLECWWWCWSWKGLYISHTLLVVYMIQKLCEKKLT